MVGTAPQFLAAGRGQEGCQQPRVAALTGVRGVQVEQILGQGQRQP